MMTHAPQFTRWLDDFFASYYRLRPVNATFIGEHAHDGRLPDYSEAGLAEMQADAEGQLRSLAALPAETLAPAEAIDRQLAAGFLEIQRWELGSQHAQRGNPCAYTGEAIFGVIGLFRRPATPLAARVEAATQRMEAIPALLGQAQANLRAAPAAWVEKAIDECAGGLAFFGAGIDALIAEQGIAAPSFRGAADRALAAFGEFQRFLERDLGPRATDEYACGEAALELLLRRGHCLSMAPADVEDYAWEQFSRASAALATGAPDFGAKAWPEALAKLADLHPSTEGYYARYAELWEACRASAEAHKLVTWPDYPIRYVPQPAWARAAAPHLYFLFYHAPAPLDGLPDHEYLVTPIGPDMPPAEQERRLRATNDSVIKLNHVVHHGALGHHVQNWYAARAASRIGQVAAVDCAARIAMFCGGTMAEGWACYATELMGEFGFLTPLEHFAEQHARLRMAARALIDVRLHTGAITLDQAAAFYHERVGMPAPAARAEATKNSMYPGTALMYLVGTDAIHALRRELAERPGFELRAFHDQLLSFGSIPVALAAAAMKAAVAE